MAFDFNNIKTSNLNDCFDVTYFVNNYIQNIIIRNFNLPYSSTDLIRFNYSDENKIGFMIFYLHDIQTGNVLNCIIKTLISHIDFLKHYNIRIAFYGYTGNISLDINNIFVNYNENGIALNTSNIVAWVKLLSTLYYEITYNISISLAKDIKINNSKKEVSKFFGDLEEYQHYIKIIFKRHVVKSILNFFKIKYSTANIHDIELYDLIKILKQHGKI